MLFRGSIYSLKLFVGQTSKNVQDGRKQIEVELVCLSVCSDVLGVGLSVKLSISGSYE